MEQWRKQPLTFGEILDITFRIVKAHFSKMFLLLLILIGPIYLIDALTTWAGGAAFFRAPINASGTIENILSQFESSGEINTELLATLSSPTLITLGVISAILSIILMPVADAGIIIMVGNVRDGKNLDIKQIIKQAFSRYWALLGSSLVYFLLIFLMFGLSFGLVIGGTAAVFFFPAPDLSSPAIASIMGIIGILVFLFSIYFITRWSFYFVSVVFEKVAPGIGKSWRLTRKNFWRLLGLYIVLTIITSIISAILGIAVEGLLGSSVLGSLVQNLISLIIMMILFVGYTVAYFDLRIRNGAEDLEDLITDYEDTENTIDNQPRD